MVTVYDLIQQLKEKKLYSSLILSGVISSKYVNYLHVYETYLACSSEDKKKMSCYEETAKATFVSVDRVRKIVAHMMSTETIWLKSQPKETEKV